MDAFTIIDDEPYRPAVEPVKRWHYVRCARCGEWVTFLPEPIDAWIGDKRLCRLCLDLTFGVDRTATAEIRKRNQAAFDECFDGKEE